MATRATYQWEMGGQTVYNHWDNYPTKARLFLMGTRTSEDFLKRNPRAEPTHSHEFHGDTDYRYTIYDAAFSKDKMLLVERADGYGDGRKFTKIFHSELYKFLEWDGVAEAVEAEDFIPGLPVVQR